MDTAKKSKELREWLVAIVVAVVIVVLMRTFLFSTYVVSGESMQPNFHDRDRLIINKLAYTFSTPKKGDVVVLHATSEDDYIKRVVALPGDKIKVEGDAVYVNDVLLPEKYIADEVRIAGEVGRTYNSLDQSEVVVPEGHVFVLGDNRSNSRDSRALGSIPIDEIVGTATVRFYPFMSFSLVRANTGG